MPSTVLVVDDRELNLELITDYLQGLGFTVITASSGQQALGMIAANPPDLVLLDVMMPGMDGFEACRRIKAAPGGRLLPVVLITSLTQSSDRVQGLEVGADDFISKPVDRFELIARVQSLLRLKAHYDRLDGAEQVMLALARAVEAKDPFTESHTERVAHSSRMLGRAAGIDDAALDDVYLGAILHDIGKIGIPDTILMKPGMLEPAEIELMRSHVVIGEQIVRPLHSAAGILPIIRHHHERFDGQGYPDGLKGQDIPLAARVVAICDSWDAMTNERPYRAALTTASAVAELREGSGLQFDPELVERFLEAFETSEAVCA